MNTYMKERIELARAMKDFYPLASGQCDYIPPLELIGIYIVHATVTRMVTRGELSIAAGTFLNASVGCHAFSILHHCTHESISQHNPEHERLENTVFRLASRLLFFDDGYKVAHRAHHFCTNHDDDPDLLMSHSSLPVLGNALHRLSSGQVYVSIGVPVSVNMLSFLYWTGLSNWLGSPENINKAPFIQWEHNVLKMLTFEGLNALETMDGAADVHRTLRATWNGSAAVSYFLLSLFFARYPHKNGPKSNNEVDGFYDCTYRGQGEVDLWMTGEGAHHMHHAKGDISYAHLQNVCRAVEDKYPHMKTGARSNGDVRTLEQGHHLPAKQTAHSPPSMQFHIDRTAEVTAAKEIMHTDPTQAVARIAHAVLTSVLHVCVTSDKGLLRNLHKGMRLADYADETGHPFPYATWDKTVFAESTSRELRVNATLLAEEVRKVAKGVGGAMPPGVLGEETAFKARYLDFFVQLADVMVTKEQQAAFGLHCAKHANLPVSTCDVSREGFLHRLKAHLESPVDSDFLRGKETKGSGSMQDTMRVVEHMVFGIGTGTASTQDTLGGGRSVASRL